MWVARDKDGTLALYKEKPVRGSLDKERWVTFWPAYECFEIDRSLFSNLKWEDEPIEVDIAEHGLKEKYDQLNDEYDSLNMKFLSQVSLYKSLYEKEKKKNNNQICG